MIKLKDILLENAKLANIAGDLIGNDVDLVINNYIDWLESNLEDLEADGDLTARQRFDTVLKARFALMDAEADDVVAYILRHHGESMNPSSELLQFIKKFV